LPEEATYVSRSKCYDLPAVRYTSLKSEFIRTTSELAAEAGGEIPADKIAQIEAQVGGKLIRSNLIILDPLSQEEPPTGYSVLQRPKAAPDCDIIGRILSGGAKDYILVTRVFHGMESSRASVQLSGSGKVSVDIEQAIQKILGATPKAHVQVSGSILTVQYSKTADEQSLAVQSAFVNPDQLARIYLRTHNGNTGLRLEAQVQEYLTGAEPNLLIKVRIVIEDLLQAIELRAPTAAALYGSVFTGEKLVETDRAGIPQEQWDSLALVAAALEIVGPQQR